MFRTILLKRTIGRDRKMPSKIEYYKEMFVNL
jgi:hypothetical protein